MPTVDIAVPGRNSLIHNGLETGQLGIQRRRPTTSVQTRYELGKFYMVQIYARPATDLHRFYGSSDSRDFDPCESVKTRGEFDG
jgi:hypothetical protein